MRKLLLICIALGSLTALLPPTTAAGGCAGAPCLGIVDVAGLAYIDDRGVLGNGVWIYLESNGEAGLQRGGCSAVLPTDCEICQGHGGDEPCSDTPDTLVY